MRLAHLMLVCSFVVYAPFASAQWTTDASGNVVQTTPSAKVVIGSGTPATRFNIFGSGAFGGGTASQFNMTNTVAGATFAQLVRDDGYWALVDSASSTRMTVGPNQPVRFFGDVVTGTNLTVGAPNTGVIQTQQIGNYGGDTVGHVMFSYSTANVDFSQTHPNTGVFRWTFPDGEKMRLSRNGALGLGTGSATPADRLHIKDGNLRIEHSNANAELSAVMFNEGAALYGFLNQRGSTHPLEPGLFNIGNAAANGAVALWSGGARRMTIASTGQIGIGMAPSATHTLAVSGDAHFTGKVTGGNIVAKYQDIAEWVPSIEELTAGTVVVLDPERNNHVLASSQAYDTSVAGVVSAQPGLTLGEEGPSKAMIATTGRVRVRVDARQHAIRIGDLLATSSIPGTAMKSEAMEINGRRFHQPGTIIGKALEPLDGGVGEILVLLSMQ